ncbi:MAG: hypothetical protein HY243_06185 [Proteobacteria bacterium]|nr:hypothetical protein [Pseudomonadota bacterium]
MDSTGLSPQIWFPVVTLIIGAVLKGLYDTLADRRTLAREREARRDQRRGTSHLNRAVFQRTTLLELQEAAAQLARFTGQANHQDVMAYRASGKWQKQLITEDVDEGSRKANVRVNLLRVRVRDETVRQLAELFSTLCVDSVFATSEQEARDAITQMGKHLTQLQERIGIVLRNLDDEEDHLLA